MMMTAMKAKKVADVAIQVVSNGIRKRSLKKEKKGDR